MLDSIILVEALSACVDLVDAHHDGEDKLICHKTNYGSFEQEVLLD